MKYPRIVISLLSALSAAGVASAQSVNLIERQLDGVRTGLFELGPFYLTPSLRFATGYDSNALSTPVAEPDYMARVAPGVRIGVPFGSAAFVDLTQEVDFVWYREQVDLRQVFDVTKVGGGWGGRRFLLQAENEFRAETRRPSSEFDFPVDTKTNAFDTSLAFALGWRQELSLGYERERNEIQDRSLEDGTVAERLNFVRDAFSADLSRRMTERTRAVLEGFYEESRFEDVTRDNDSYGMRAGFDFRDPVVPAVLAPLRAGLDGRLLLGFRKVVPLDGTRVDYTGLIGSVDVSVRSESGHGLRGIFSRDVIPSIFDDNWYFVENRFGGSFHWQLHERFSIEPGFARGTNDYPLPALVRGEDGELVEGAIVDEHTSYRLTVDYRVHSVWTVGVTAEYLDRRSNLDAFDKDRLQISFQMALAPR